MARPRKIDGPARRKTAKLVGKYGAEGVKTILSANSSKRNKFNQALVALRVKSGLPKVNISSVSLTKIAEEFGVALEIGRRPNGSTLRDLVKVK